MRDTHDADMAEWRRLRRLRTQLEPLAYIFERTNSECTGQCDRPKVIYQDQDTGEKITCCNLQAPWERYHETRKLERVIGAKLQVGRKPFEAAKTRDIESPLKDAYERTHTATYIGRKLRLAQEPGKDESVDEDTNILPKLLRGEPKGKT